MNEEYEGLLSKEILTKLQHTFVSPYFTARSSVKERTDYLTLVQQLAHIIPITARVRGIATHPEDDVIWQYELPNDHIVSLIVYEQPTTQDNKNQLASAKHTIFQDQDKTDRGHTFSTAREPSA